MPYFNQVDATALSQEWVDTFYGYDHEPKIAEGAWYETQNLTAEYYPLMSSRARRGIKKTLTNPHGLLGKSQMAWVEGNTLYYGGTPVEMGDIQLSSGQKTLISMGAYIVILPDKVYYNTEDSTDHGTIENTTTSTNVSAQVVLLTGEAISYTASATAPGNAASGQYWLDTSGSVHSLKVYSAESDMWTSVATVYVKLSATGIGIGFKEDDGVTISGLAAPALSGAAKMQQVKDLNGSHILYGVGDDYVIITGILDSSAEGLSCTIKRGMPNMDYITEAQNRLWGCKYGLGADGSTLNEIYCCALGDFKNWQRYAGISTDSYTASCGTDGPWTGAVTYQGYPIFFKEHHMHKVYISTSGAHQIVDTECRGVQSGCSRSLAVVGDSLYYKSRDGITVYDGSLPHLSGNALGNDLYYDAVGGSIGDKYYVSMRRSDNSWHLFCLDTGNGMWMHEDNTHALAMARCGDDLYWIDGSNRLVSARGTDGTLEDPVHWSAETGVIGYNSAGNKYVSRFDIRTKLPQGSTLNVYIEYDSDGVWHPCGFCVGNGLRTLMLPVRPVRCDHFRLRLTGVGEFKIYSFAKNYLQGSDG